jgi:hypothetical protein
MPTARVPVVESAGGARVPPTAALTLRRLSGRQVAMWLDPDKTLGPVYVGQASQELYADVGPYELLLQPSPPSGRVYSFPVQVGVGTTPEPPANVPVTFADLEQALAADRASLVARFADVTAAEQISGAWDFLTAPTLDGEPFAGGGMTAGQLEALLTGRFETERTTSDTRYANLDAPEVITGPWDFAEPPTVEGLPVGPDLRTEVAALQDALLAVQLRPQTITAYTARASDLGGVIEMTAAGANTVTIPPDVFTVGQVLQVAQVGTGVTTISPGAGVTLQWNNGSPGSGARALAGQHAEASLTCRGPNLFRLTGALS